jgi:FMN reductase
MTGGKPLIVGIGGSPRSQSSSERALRFSLQSAQDGGAEIECFSGAALAFPMFSPGEGERTTESRRFLDAVRRADGLIIATPGYHGSISGLVKNALDYTEDLREDHRPYFEGRAVACIACAAGWQAAVTTLTAVRSIVHALRGWPTPLGIAINSQAVTFTSDGACSEASISGQLHVAVAQVLAFASGMRASDPVVAEIASA